MDVNKKENGSEHSKNQDGDDISSMNSSDTENNSNQGFLKGIIKNTRLLVFVAVIACISVFSIQNLNMVELRFLWMEVRVFQFAAIAGAFVAGIIVGKIPLKFLINQ